MGARPIGSHGRYPEKWFTVPSYVSERAKLGLYYRSKSNRAYRDRTEVGAERAAQLSAPGARVTLRDVAVMRAWFARHSQDVALVGFDAKNPTNGWKSILLWGGLEAVPWLDEIWKEHGVRDNPALVRTLAYVAPCACARYSGSRYGLQRVPGRL